MSNFTIHFTIPWLLLLLIPAVLITLIPHLRLVKKYRRTRNRILSIVLQMCILTLVVFTAAGLNFTYDLPNRENEVLLLVDVSDSNGSAMDSKNEFIRQIIEESGSRFSMGVVTFGYDCEYAAELSFDNEKVYSEYLRSLEESKVDTSATDVAQALKYVMDGGLLSSPDTAKIVIVSDGAETDGDALTEIKRVAAKGIRVDTVCFPDPSVDDVRLIEVSAPDYNVIAGDEFSFDLAIASSIGGTANVTVSQNGEQKSVTGVELVKGNNYFSIKHVFDMPGLYKMEFGVQLEGSTADSISQNNTYCSYMNLQVFDKVLILESIEGEASELTALLSEDEDYGLFDVDVINIKQHPEDVPKTTDELRQYDEVILANISNGDLTKTEGVPPKFDEMLNSFCKDYGGGVFAIGGSEPGSDEEKPVAHAFNIEDMQSAKAYADLLPVEAVNYKPPLGLIIIIDRSNSMANTVQDNMTRLDLAKKAARSCLSALTYRDYVGVMSLDDTYSVNCVPRNILYRGEIEATIDSIVPGDSTVFYNAIDRAGLLLQDLGDAVERKHIILVTDGKPDDELDDWNGDLPPYGDVIDNNLKNDITFSTMLISSDESVKAIMQQAAERGGGRPYSYTDDNAGELIDEMRRDLEVPSLSEIEYSTYVPKVRTHNSVLLGVDEERLPELNGFYGTRAKSECEVVLEAPHRVPLYAQMQHGVGKSGAFMCQLNGSDWSSEFLYSDTGKRILYNIVSGLMPNHSIRPSDVSVGLTEQNYSTDVNIYTALGKGERVDVTVTDYTTGSIVKPTQAPDAAQGYSVAKYTIKNAGLYKIQVQKIGADGMPISSGYYETYKTFSYSKEYELFLDEEQSRLTMTEWASGGKGKLVSEAADVFTEFEMVIHMKYDPRPILIIAAIVLFLLDIAVRKFKFKWLHELVRDYREKKRMSDRSERS